MPAARDLTGQRFGRLVVEALGAHDGPNRKWRSRCDCGKTVEVRAQSLTRGVSTSCGCQRRETTRKTMTKHGHCTGRTTSRTYQSWRNMIARCSNPDAQNFAAYGGRGIRVCDRWLQGFANFLADMGERPPNMTIDRIDVDGNYEPGNCRWATDKEQRANKRGGDDDE